MALLEIKGLKKQFGGLLALGGVDFHIAEGEIVSVIGPNGAGKTTFFNVISGMFAPDEGEIIFDGREVSGLTPDQITRRGISRTFQNVRLFQNMTILENVMVAQHSHTHKGVFPALFQTPGFRKEEREIRERAREVLGFFGTRLVGYIHLRRHEYRGRLLLGREPVRQAGRWNYGAPTDARARLGEP